MQGVLVRTPTEQETWGEVTGNLSKHSISKPQKKGFWEFLGPETGITENGSQGSGQCFLMEGNFTSYGPEWEGLPLELSR